jgi:hypothetical protein
MTKLIKTILTFLTFIISLPMMMIGFLWAAIYSDFLLGMNLCRSYLAWLEIKEEKENE